MPFDSLPADPSTLTAGEIVARVAAGLVQQGRPAVSRYGNCTYYNQRNGERCAVGLLLSVAEATTAPHNTSVSSWLRSSKRAAFPARLQPHAKLLALLQALHDNWHALRQAEARLGAGPGVTPYRTAVDSQLHQLARWPDVRPADSAALRRLMLPDV